MDYENNAIRIGNGLGMMAIPDASAGGPARTKPGTASSHLPHLDQPGTEPCLSFGMADRCSRRHRGGCLQASQKEAQKCLSSKGFS